MVPISDVAKIQNISFTEDKDASEIKVFKNSSTTDHTDTQSQEIKSSKKNELIKLCANNKIDLKALYNVEVEQLNDEAFCEELLEKVNNLIKQPSKLQKLKDLTSECSKLNKHVGEIFACDLQTATEDDLNKMADTIELAKKKLGKNANAEDIAKEAKKFNIGLNGGFSKEYLSSNLDYLDNGKSLDEKLQEFYPKYFRDPNNKNRMRTLKELDPETRKIVLEGYFNNFFEQKKAKLGEAYAKKLQMQDFAKILINTKDEDKEFIADAIKELMADNRLNGLFATEASFETLANKLKWNDSITTAQKADIIMKKDLNGNNLEGTEDALNFIVEINRNQTFEGRKNDINDLTETCQDIERKEAQGEKLTESEEYIKAIKVLAEEANIISNGTSNVIRDKEQIEELTKLTDESAIRILTKEEYIQAYENVKKYIEEHQNILSMPKENFYETLDKVTDGRFTQIANGNGNSIEIHNPTEYAKSITTTNTIGFATSPFKGNEKLEFLTQQVNNTQEKDSDYVVEKNDNITMNKNKTIVSSPIKYFFYVSTNGRDKGMKIVGDNYADACSFLKKEYITYLEENKNNLYNILYSASSAAQIAAIEAKLVDKELGEKLGLTSDKIMLISNIEEQDNKKSND